MGYHSYSSATVLLHENVGSYCQVSTQSLSTTCYRSALEDLDRDGDHKLLVGDLGSGQFDMKLKVYRGM